MSERLNSVDIEDVLSSIRRLVSEDARVAPKAPPAAAVEPAAPDVVPAPKAAPEPVVETVAPEEPVAPAEMSVDPVPVSSADAPVVPAFTSARRDGFAATGDEVPRRKPVPVVDPQADKLILTPSLRIVPEPVEAPEAPSEEVEPVAEAPMMEDATEEALVDVAEPPPAAPLHAIRIERAAARLDALVDQVAQGLDPAREDWEPAGEAPRAFASGWAEDEVAEDAVPAATATDMEAETAAAPDQPVEAAGWETAGWATPDWQAVEPEAAPAPEMLDGVEEPEAWPEAGEEGAITEENSGSSAEEPAMTQKDDPVELPDWAEMEKAPAEAAAFAAASRATAAEASSRWADDAEAQIRRELEEEVETSAFARFDDEDDLDNRPFDEEMLRDLVRDIIREELQGALGERITRNVRKLVRAEIARALAVRDFE